MRHQNCFLTWIRICSLLKTQRKNEQNSAYIYRVWDVWTTTINYTTCDAIRCTRPKCRVDQFVGTPFVLWRCIRVRRCKNKNDDMPTDRVAGEVIFRRDRGDDFRPLLLPRFSARMILPTVRASRGSDLARARHQNNRNENGRQQQTSSRMVDAGFCVLR